MRATEEYFNEGSLLERFAEENLEIIPPRECMDAGDPNAYAKHHVLRAKKLYEHYQSWHTSQNTKYCGCVLPTGFKSEMQKILGDERLLNNMWLGVQILSREDAREGSKHQTVCVCPSTKQFECVHGF